MDSSPNFVLISARASCSASVFFVLLLFPFFADGFFVFFVVVFLDDVIGLYVEGEINNLFALLSVVRVQFHYSISFR